jgi:archaellum component FlaC
MMSKNIDEKVDQMEEAVEQYASANTVISIGGYSFTPAKLMIAGTIVSTILGGLYGAFEVYKDYMDMKQQIQEYVAPDLSGINERLTALDKKMEGIAANVQQSTEYTNEIKNDLKGDIRRVEGVVESVERSSKQSQRETDISVKEVRGELRALQKETDLAIKESNSIVDKKIKQALDNPLAQ